MLEQQCPAKVLQRKTKTDEAKVWTSRLAQHWTFLLCDNEDDDDEQKSNWLSLDSPERWFYPPWLSRTQTAPYELFSHLPSSQPEHQPRLAWTYSGRELTDQRIYSTVRRTREKHLVCLFICLSVWSIDHPTTIALPEIAVRDYLFGEPHLFFKWPYLSLKKWDTWGQWGRECFFFSFGFWNFLCASLSDLLSSRRHFLSLRTLGICRLVLLAGGVSIMSRLLCLKNVALAVSVSDLSLFSLVDNTGL